MNTHSKRRYNVLSVALVSKVTAPGHYHDGHGLILRVTRAGTKQWVQRLRIRGKRRELGLGGYPLVTLAMAREAALANRRKVHAGGGLTPISWTVDGFRQCVDDRREPVSVDRVQTRE